MGLGEQDKKQAQKTNYEIKTEQVHEGPVHQEGGPQTQANLQTNAPQLVDTQIEENMQLVAQAQATMEQTHATETAQGGPVCEQILQNEKFFQRRKRRKLQTRLAKQLSGNANADYVSYNLHQAQVLKKTMMDNSKRLLGIPADADSYLSKFFLKGCQLNQDGKPASPQDEENLKADRKLWEAFSGGDVMARKPYLDNMVSDVLKVDLTMDKLTPEYLERHGMEVLRQSQLLTEAEKVLFSDPVNKQYSCALPDTVLIQIRKVLKANRMLKMDKLAQQAFEKHGVKGDGSGTWSDEWTKKKESAYKTAIKQMKETRTDPDLPILAKDLTKAELALRRQKQAELARKEGSPISDHISYRVHMGTRLDENKIAPLEKSELTREMQGFFRVYEMDEKGNPIDQPMEQAIYEYNKQAEKNYSSGDINEQIKYLTRYINEMINTIPDPEEMLTEKYLEDHMEEFAHITQITTCYSNYDDSHTGPELRKFFDSLPQTVKTRINAISDVAIYMQNVLYHVTSPHVVTPAGKYMTEIQSKRDLKALLEGNTDDLVAEFREVYKRNKALLDEFKKHPTTIEEEVARERREKQTEQARQLSGNKTADYVGYQLHEGMEQRRTMTENSKKKLGIPADADAFLSKFFLKGCMLNEKGEPATPQDAANLEADRKLWEAFSGDNVMARKPYLDNMIADVLKVNLTIEKLTPYDLQVRGMEIYRQCELLADAEKVLFQDKGNWQYMKTLSDETFMRLRSILKLNHNGTLQKLVHETFRKHGVNVDSEKLWEEKPWSEENERQYQELQEAYRRVRVDPKLNVPASALTKEELAERRQAQKQLAQKEAGFRVLVDHNTYNCRAGMKEFESKIGNTLEQYDEMARMIEGAKLTGSENDRLWETFCRVVVRTEDGKPATAMDEAALKYNETLIEDYLSGDFERRKPYVDNYLNELMNLEITADMFTDEYMEEHAIEVWRKIELLGNFEFVITKNPANLAYFESLPESVRNRVKKVEGFYNGEPGVIESMITLAYSEYLAKKGLNGDGNYESNYLEMDDPDVMDEDLDERLQLKINLLEEHRKRMDQASKQEGGMIREIRAHRMTVLGEIRKERRDRKEANKKNMIGQEELPSWMWE